MTKHELFNEEFATLAEAVIAGDLVRAKATLQMIELAGPARYGEIIRRARRRVDPTLRPDLTLAVPDVFPKPGAEPGDTLSAKGLWKDRAAA